MSLIPITRKSGSPRFCIVDSRGAVFDEETGYFSTLTYDQAHKQGYLVDLKRRTCSKRSAYLNRIPRDNYFTGYTFYSTNHYQTSDLPGSEVIPSLPEGITQEELQDGYWPISINGQDGYFLKKSERGESLGQKIQTPVLEPVTSWA